MLTTSILGTPVQVIDYAGVVAQVRAWVRDRVPPARFIVQTNVYTLVTARENPGYREALEQADLSVPDGMPLVWLLRSAGHKVKDRVYGPDMMLMLCEAAAREGWRCYLYGAGPEVLHRLQTALLARFPRLNIVGAYSPPFRELTPSENAAVCEAINGARPDILWVGLGSPKQDLWMYEHRTSLNVPVLHGVGAAFDFHAGEIRQAPRWMMGAGLEWLFRLLQEPRRLWRRYTTVNAKFLLYLLRDRLSSRGEHAQATPVEHDRPASRQIVRLLGVDIDNLTARELDARILRIIRSGTKAMVLHVNIQGMNLAVRHPWMKDLLNHAGVVICDGDGVRLGAVVEGKKIKQKITYNRYIWQLAALSQAHHLSWYLIGSKNEVIAAAVANLQARYPGLEIKGWRDGYFNGPEDCERTKTDINRAAPNILILGMGMPTQEAWLRDNFGDLSVNAALTGGAVFEYVSGRARIIPDVLFHLKLEWLYRFLHEPRRLFARYFLGNPLFIVRVLFERLHLKSY